jgi:hypothetical protein
MERYESANRKTQKAGWLLALPYDSLFEYFVVEKLNILRGKSND